MPIEARNFPTQTFFRQEIQHQEWECSHDAFPTNIHLVRELREIEIAEDAHLLPVVPGTSGFLC